MSTSTAPSRTEPRNWFYVLLVLCGVAFVVTALAYTVVPVLEQKAIEAGQSPPPSPFRETLRAHGGEILLWLAGAVAVFALASMALDRWRQPSDSIHRR